VIPIAIGKKRNALISDRALYDNRWRPVLDDSVRCRRTSGDGREKSAIAIILGQTNLMALHVKMDQVNVAKLAVFSMLLDCKLPRAEQVSFFVGVVLGVKEPGTYLAEQKASGDCPQDE
jgi:hypothetical protein